MTSANEQGFINLTDRGDDVINCLDESEGSMTLNELAEETGDSFSEVRRTVERLEQDDRVVCDKEEPNWIVQLSS